MGRRIDLQAILVDILGSKNVYFQPPEAILMKYPCIMYRLNAMDTKYADNNPYHNRKQYEITAVDLNPDSDIPNKLAQLPLCSFERFFVADNLNHYVYNLFF